MTIGQRPRHPGSLHDAVMTIIATLGRDTAAAEVGKSTSLVYRWSDPDSDSVPNIVQAMALDSAFVKAGHGAAPILAAYRSVLTSIDKPHCPASLTERLTAVAAEVGDVAAAIRDGQHPDGPGGVKLTLWEGQKIDHEITEAIAALEDMRREVAEMTKHIPVRTTEY